MEDRGIFFTSEANGYNRAQVDSYVSKVSRAYQATYKEYQELSGKYESHLEECGKSGAQGQNGLSSDIAAKTLINTELLAKKIIDDAHAEAAKIRQAAQNILNSAKSDAEAMAYRTRRNFEHAQKVMEHAASELDKVIASNTAKKPIALSA